MPGKGNEFFPIRVLFNLIFSQSNIRHGPIFAIKIILLKFEKTS